MLLTLFSYPDSTRIFYSNDVQVLFEIVCRQIFNLSVGKVTKNLHIFSTMYNYRVKFPASSQLSGIVGENG